MNLDIEKIYVPKDLDEAVRMMQEDPEARLLFAGTDVVAQLRDHVPGLSRLIDLTKLADMPDQITFDGETLFIGGMCTHKQIASDELVNRYFPALAEASDGVGSAQIRARACIAGNLANASPACDTAPALLAAGAAVVYRNAEGEGEIPMADFFLGPRRIAIGRNAIITGLKIPVPEGGWKGHYYKVGGRTALTIAICSTAVIFSEKTGWQVAYGSVGPKTLRGVRTEEALNAGEPVSDEALKEAVFADVTPIDDVRASAQYRKLVCANLVWQAARGEE